MTKLSRLFLCSIALVLLFESNKASAAILFFDYNFSEKEVSAVREAAINRGENVIVLPTDLILESDKTEIRKLNKYSEDLRRLNADFRSRKSNNVGLTDSENAKLIELRGKLASRKNLLEKYKLTPKKIKESLDNLGIEPLNSVIISGHSDGMDYGGAMGSTDFNSIEEFLKYSGRKDEIRSIYLWGCYGATAVPSQVSDDSIVPHNQRHLI